MTADAHLRRAQALRRLLLAGAIFLPAGPALAANQCGPATPPRTSVDCPAGTYPEGIDYDVPGILDVRLAPGVLTLGSSTLRANNSLTVTGATNTLLTSSEISPTISASAIGVRLELDDVVSSNADGTAIAVVLTAGFGGSSGSISADRVAAAGTGISGQAASSGFIGVRVNSVEAGGSGIVLQARDGVSATVSELTSGGTGLSLVSRGDVGVDAGRVVAGGSGIATFSTIGDISIRSTSVVSAGTGIFASVSTRGNVVIDSGSVRVSGEGYGIYARAFGQAQITSGTVETDGNGFAGIYASGGFRVVADSVVTRGNAAPGIFAQGVGTITVGSVSTAGSQSSGIRVSGPEVGVTATGTVSTTGAGSHGIDISGGRVTIAAFNNVVATGAGADAIRVIADAPNISFSGLVESRDGYAVRTGIANPFGGRIGGASVVDVLATATLRGRLFLTDSDDLLRNRGLFDAIGTSDFGGGNDILENRDSATLRATNGAAILTGLERLDNRGRIELRDGDAGDSLVFGGAYTAAGASRLGLDANFSAGTADRLATGAATGSTVIEAAVVGGSLTRRLLLVDGGAGTSATAFTLSPISDTPYTRTRLIYEAAGNDFFLVQTPGAAVVETARLGAMTARLWQESADAVTAQLDTVRDGRSKRRGAALWVQGWTGSGGERGFHTFQGPFAPAESFDVSYRQDFDGVQGGIDFQAGSAVFGITGGAGRSEGRFSASGNPVKMNVRNVGLYAQGKAGPLFFNLIAKRDWAELSIAPAAGLGGEADADLFGVQANIGLRIAAGPAFLEPSVGLSRVEGDSDALASGPATIVADADGMRARAGLRAGAKLGGRGFSVMPFASIDLFEELGHGRGADFTLGDTIRLTDAQSGTRAQAGAGVSVAAGGFEAFVRGDLALRDEGGRAVRAGARLRF